MVRNCERCQTPAVDQESFCRNCGSEIANPVSPELKAVQPPSGYRLLDELGRGAAGTVYLGEQMSLRRQVAIKRIRAQVDNPAAAQFNKEARALAALNHPSIVAAFDLSMTDDSAWMIMQFVEGQDLQSLLSANTELPLERSLDILNDVASALTAAHEAGYIHRDVKPANILIGRGGRGLLSDFGIATLQDAGAQPGQIVGTPAFMAPEQTTGHHATPATDVYSLGLVAYNLMYGTNPYTSLAEGLPPEQAVQAILTAQRETPLPHPKTADRRRTQLFGVIQRATAKDPAQRFSSAAEFIEKLNRAVGYEAGLQTSERWLRDVVQGKKQPPKKETNLVKICFVAALIGALAYVVFRALS